MNQDYVRLGSQLLRKSELSSFSLGNNESFTIHLKNGGYFRLAKGDPGHAWVLQTYRDAWRRTTSECSEQSEYSRG